MKTPGQLGVEAAAKDQRIVCKEVIVGGKRYTVQISMADIIDAVREAEGGGIHTTLSACILPGGGAPPMMRYTAEVARDAGLYRTWLATTYGHVFTLGGGAGVWADAQRHARALARLTGLPLATIIADVRADYATISEED